MSSRTDSRACSASFASILDGIGNTPLVEVAGVWAKLEFLNPSGSVKARIARYIVERAEAQGLLRPGDTIVEASEILRQLPAVPDAIVMGVGTGGTLIGVGQSFRAVNPSVRLVAVEPDESCTLRCGEVCQHRIEGISDGFVPGIVDRHRDLIDEVCAVSSSDSLDAMRWLARTHGMFVGPSSGAHLVAARRLRERDPSLRTVVTVFCDEGEKYISDHFAVASNTSSHPVSV